uniref:Mediator of RNA polymerase II transcription subunit 7 n=2 Tax=Macrostomum lignano TaxID=282301 RepID=A0A1I8HWI3_9PLAT
QLQMSDSSRISAFPLPPMQYVNCYTDERVHSGTAPPPPRPLDSSYAMFGMPCTKEDAVIHSLESQGIRRLYPALYDHKRELKKLNFSILANYLDLMDIVVKCPDSQERLQKLEHMKTLFINVHHLINEYRPLQARDTLIEMLSLQSSVTHQSVDTASRYLARADAVVGRAAAASVGGDEDEPMRGADEAAGGEISQALLNDIDKLSAELSELTAAAAELDDAESAGFDLFASRGDDGNGDEAAGDSATDDVELEVDSDETSEDDDEADEAGEAVVNLPAGHQAAVGFSSTGNDAASGSLAQAPAAEAAVGASDEAPSVLDDLDSLLAFN